MTKFSISLAAFMTLVPGTVAATDAPSDNGAVPVSADHFAYIHYILSKDDVANIVRSIDASCPQKSGDSGSTLAAEPRHQTACRNKQVARLEARHKRDYRAAKSGLSEQAKPDYSAEYLGWVKTRYAACERDRRENLGGAMKNAVFATCKLIELNRRLAWRGVL
jgi:uncharacterized protein YecT (DUF1311 family)